MDSFMNNNNGAAAGQGGMGNVGAGGAPQKQDYGDKAFGMLSKKAGHPTDANTTEKITDGIRNVYEKTTGKKVNPKISN